MYVFVNDSCQVTLEEADDFRAFKLVSALPPDALTRVLNGKEGVGYIEESNYAWVSLAWLRERAPKGEGLEQMLTFARKHRWVDSTERYVRAHIEIQSVRHGTVPSASDG